MRWGRRSPGGPDRDVFGERRDRGGGIGCAAMERIYSGAGNKRNPNPMGSDFLPFGRSGDTGTNYRTALLKALYGGQTSIFTRKGVQILRTFYYWVHKSQAGTGSGLIGGCRPSRYFFKITLEALPFFHKPFCTCNSHFFSS